MRWNFFAIRMKLKWLETELMKIMRSKKCSRSKVMKHSLQLPQLHFENCRFNFLVTIKIYTAISALFHSLSLSFQFSFSASIFGGNSFYAIFHIESVTAAQLYIVQTWMNMYLYERSAPIWMKRRQQNCMGTTLCNLHFVYSEKRKFRNMCICYFSHSSRTVEYMVSCWLVLFCQPAHRY